jgi:transcriptional regulator of nitric oxide reductase
MNSGRIRWAKAFAAFAIVCGLSWIVAKAADRIFTNPGPEAHLKQLFPAAVAFSLLSVEPLHSTARAADPRVNPAARPIGVAFWTTDRLPLEHGYHGPIHILVGMDLAGTLTGVVVDSDTEPYGYFQCRTRMSV